MLCPNHELTPFFFLFTKHDAMTISSRTKAATMFDADILKAGTRCHKTITLVAFDVFDRMTFMSTIPLVSPPAKPTSLLPSDACLCRQPSCCACSL
jgi:hypothetical protein